MHLHNNDACSPQGVLETEEITADSSAQSECIEEGVPWVLEGRGEFEIPGPLLREEVERESNCWQHKWNRTGRASLHTSCWSQTQLSTLITLLAY